MSHAAHANRRPIANAPTIILVARLSNIIMLSASGAAHPRLRRTLLGQYRALPKPSGKTGLMSSASEDPAVQEA